MTHTPSGRPLPPPVPDGILPAVRASFSDPWRKPLGRMLFEIAAATVRGRGLPRYYFRNLLYRVDVADFRDYLTNREERQINAFIADPVRSPFLENKLLFHHHFRYADVRLPVYLGHSVGPVFSSDEGTHRLEGPDDLLRLGEVLRARSGAAGVFAKPIGGIHGSRCFRLDSGSTAAGVQQHYHDLCTGSFVFEEALRQHPLVSEIYPHSINTLRLVTCTAGSGGVEVVSALIRFGANCSVIDNSSAGGVFIRVDMDSGALGPYARKFHEFGGTIHPAHPDTGVEFAGRVLPFFEPALEMARTAAAHLPYRLIGWDLAITPDGPVLIEGNHNPHIFGAEIADGGYRRNPVFRSFLEEVPLS